MVKTYCLLSSPEVLAAGGLLLLLSTALVGWRNIPNLSGSFSPFFCVTLYVPCTSIFSGALVVPPLAVPAAPGAALVVPALVDGALGAGARLVAAAAHPLRLLLLSTW